VRVHSNVRDDSAAEGLEVSCHGISDFLGAAARKRPSDGVSGGGQNKAERSRAGRFEREHRMSAQTGPESACFLAAEQTFTD